MLIERRRRRSRKAYILYVLGVISKVIYCAYGNIADSRHSRHIVRPQKFKGIVYGIALFNIGFNKIKTSSRG